MANLFDGLLIAMGLGMVVIAIGNVRLQRESLGSAMISPFWGICWCVACYFVLVATSSTAVTKAASSAIASIALIVYCIRFRAPLATNRKSR